MTTNNNDVISKSEKYFNNILLKEKNNDNYEDDCKYGYIKIGNLLTTDKKNAVVVLFDSVICLKIYELDNNEWKQIFIQKNLEISTVYGIEAYIEDYNFDGHKDIGLRNEVSNGTSIMSFHLWVYDKDTFIEIPEFQNIGNPMIIKNKKIIQGYSACCAFSEITLSNYNWTKNNLIQTKQLNISNYPHGSGLEANITEIDGQNTRKATISEKDIEFIIDKYSSNWMIIDTTANSSTNANTISSFVAINF